MPPTFTGQGPRSFDPLPEGDYNLVISKINSDIVGSQAKNAGAEMWRVSYDIVSTDRKVFDNLVFVQKSFWRISNWWRALGNEVVPGKEIDLGEPETHLGKTLRAHLSIREYAGAKDNQVEYFIEPKPKSESDEPDSIPF